MDARTTYGRSTRALLEIIKKEDGDMGLLDKMKNMIVPQSEDSDVRRIKKTKEDIVTRYEDIMCSTKDLTGDDWDDSFGYDAWGSIDKDAVDAISQWLEKGHAGWGNSGLGTWSSTTATTTSYIPLKKAAEPDPDELWRKALKRASDIATEMNATDVDLQRMLADSDFLMGVATIFENGNWNENFNTVTVCSAEDIIEACNGTVVWRSEYPLSHDETRDALRLMGKLGSEYYRSIHQDERSYTDEWKRRKHDNLPYLDEICNARAIWKSASESFCGHQGMIPVLGLRTISEEAGCIKLRRRDVEALAALTGADSMFASYDAGVPIEDVIA